MKQAEIAVIRDLHAQTDGRGRRQGGACRGDGRNWAPASVKDMGKVMAALKERFAGQMDFGKASRSGQGQR